MIIKTAILIVMIFLGGNNVTAQTSQISTNIGANNQVALPAAGDGTRLPAAGDGTRLPAAGDGTGSPATGDGTRLPAAGDGTRLPATGDGSGLPDQDQIQARALKAQELQTGSAVPLMMMEVLTLGPDKKKLVNPVEIVTQWQAAGRIDSSAINMQVRIHAIKSGEKTKLLPDRGYTTIIPIKTSQINSTDVYTLRAAMQPLMAAIKELTPVDQSVNDQDEKDLAAKKGVSKQASSGNVSPASNAKQNEPASAYKLPDPLTPKVETPAPKVEIKVTSNGCGINVAYEQDVAIQQTKMVTLENGVQTKESTCTDSDQKYPLKKNYNACTYDVNISGRKVTAKYQAFYNKPDASIESVGECRVDPEKIFDITEKTDSCESDINIPSRIVTQRAELIYINHRNSPVTVRACGVTKTTWKMSEDALGCDIREDIAALKAYRQAKLVYTDGSGVTRIVQDCQDTKTIYPMMEDFAGCDIREDIAALKAYRQAKLVYAPGSGAARIAQDCKDTKTTYTMMEDFAGCELNVNMTDHTIVRKAKLVYSANNKTIEARACADSTTKIQMAKVYDVCKTSINQQAGNAVRQFRWAATIDQERKFYSECADDVTQSSALESDSQSCDVKVELAKRSATVMAKFTHTQAGQQSEVSTCRATQTIYTIASKPNQCEWVVELSNNRAVAQEALYYTDARSGIDVEVQGCTPTAITKPLQKDYKACDDEIVGRTAKDRYTLFYLDGENKRKSASQCQVDTQRVFQISENANDCKIGIDFGNNQATPQAELGYSDTDGIYHQVRACQASQIAQPVSLQESSEGCSIRHDFQNDKSIQQKSLIYTLNDKTFAARPCADSNQEYAHKTVYTLSDGSLLCEPHINTQDGEVFALGKVQISNGAGQSMFISGCDRTRKQSQNVLTTTNGCLDPANWTHDLTSGISYAQERLYYESGGSRVYFTECRNSTTTLVHQINRKGWQSHDKGLFSYPVNEVYITPATGKHVIDTSGIAVGETQQPYIYQETRDIVNGETRYITGSCDASRLTTRSKVYKRPDDTLFYQPIGGGTAVPANACDQTTVGTPVWTFVRSYGCGTPLHTSGLTSRCVKGTYSGLRQVVRDDSQLIDQPSSGYKTFICREIIDPLSSLRQKIEKGETLPNITQWIAHINANPSLFFGCPVTRTDPAWNTEEGW